MRRRALLACAVGATVAATAGALVGPRSDAGTTPARSPTALADGLPAPVRPSFTPGAPVPAEARRFVSTFAPVLRATTARARPSSTAAAVAPLETRTPEDTTNIVAVLDRRATAHGLWVRVRLATLPNSRTGWVPRSVLGGYGTVDTHLVVDLRRLTATLLRRGRVVFRARVGVGQSQWSTPRGQFYIRNRLTRFAGPVYGPLAFGTSARSEHLTDWPDGGFIGIHGTDEPQLIPGRVSHGCIRMRNRDILALAKRMPIGTPLTIQ